MPEEHDEEMKEMMEEMAEDLEETHFQEKNSHRKTGLSALTPQGQVLIFGGLGVLVLVVLLYFLFRGDKGVPPDEFNAMKGRLDRVESKLIQVETASRESLGLKKQIPEMEKTLSKLDRSLRALREQISQQSLALDRMKQSAAGAVKQKEAAPQTQKRIHVVVRGDTLFGIARKYGVSVEQIRRLNKFSKNKAIYPGQKLMIP